MTKAHRFLYLDYLSDTYVSEQMLLLSNTDKNCLAQVETKFDLLY